MQQLAPPQPWQPQLPPPAETSPPTMSSSFGSNNPGAQTGLGWAPPSSAAPPSFSQVASQPPQSQGLPSYGASLPSSSYGDIGSSTTRPLPRSVSGRTLRNHRRHMPHCNAQLWQRLRTEWRHWRHLPCSCLPLLPPCAWSVCTACSTCTAPAALVISCAAARVRLAVAVAVSLALRSRNSE